MSWFRRLWFLVTIFLLLAAVAVLIGVVYGETDVRVTSIETESAVPMNLTAESCPEQIVRTVSVTVTVSRDSFDPKHPQWWEVGVKIRASVFENTKDRSVAVGPSGTKQVTFGFTSVEKQSWAPAESATALIQVTQGKDLLNRTQRTVLLPAVKDSKGCNE